MSMSGKQAFCGEEGYTTPLKILREATLQKQNETNFCRKKLKIIEVWYLILDN